MSWVTGTPSASASRTSVARFGLPAAFSSATSEPLLTPARAASWSADRPRLRRRARTVRATPAITAPSGPVRSSRPAPVTRSHPGHSVDCYGQYTDLMLAIVLALASSLGYGCADYAGGLASRGTSVLWVTLISIPVGLSLLVVLLPVFPAYWSGPAVVWGGLSGVFSAGAFALVYASLAVGPMSILSPLTAVISAAVPVAVGIGLEGERLTGTAAT